MFVYLIICILFVFSPNLTDGQVNCTSYVIPSPLTLSSLLTFVDIRVSCGASHVEVRLNDCALSNLGLGSDNLMLIDTESSDAIVKSRIVDSDCYPYVGLSPIYNGFDTIFRVNVSDCTIDAFKNSSHVIYKHQIRTYTDPNNPQTRSKLNDDVKVEFSCVYETNLGSNLAVASSKYRRSRFSVEPILDNLEVAMAIFPDPTFSHAILRNVSFLIPREIFVGVTFSNGNSDYLVLQARSCWLTPTSEVYGSINKTLLTSGCPIKHKGNGVKLYENYYSSQAKFSFRTFSWGSPSHQLAYVHCSVTACDSVLDDSCTQKNCLGQLEDDIYKRQPQQQSTDAKTTTISYGPIRINVSASLCAFENGGCEQICSTKLKSAISCSCFTGYKLSRNGKSCYDSTSRDFFDTLSGDVIMGIPYLEMFILVSAVVILMIVTILIRKYPLKRSKLEAAKQSQTI